MSSRNKLRLAAAVTGLLIFAAATARGQFRANPYAAVDARALTANACTVSELGRELAAPYTADSLKVRAIFRWVTANIAYDVKGFHEPGNLYSCFYLPAAYLTAAEADSAYTAALANYVFTERRGICSGYATLFKALCDAAGLHCEVVGGMARHTGYRIGLEEGGEHAWNAVLLGGRWQLLDATWGSGFVNDSVTAFYREFNEFYYLTEPQQLLNNHHPDNLRWTLVDLSPDRKLFFYYPYRYPSFYDAGIQSYYPAPGHLEPDGARRLSFEISTQDTPRCLHIVEYPQPPEDTLLNGELVRGAETLEAAAAEAEPCGHIEGNKITLPYRIRSARTTRLDVYLNGELVMSYGLSAKR